MPALPVTLQLPAVGIKNMYLLLFCGYPLAVTSNLAAS
jgi:hypothetical protein